MNLSLYWIRMMEVTELVRIYVSIHQSLDFVTYEFLSLVSYNNGLLLRIMSQINPFYFLLFLVMGFDQSKQSENIPVICSKWSEIVSLMDMTIHYLCCGPFSRRNMKAFGQLGCQNHRVLEAEFDGEFCGSLKDRNSESIMIVENQIKIHRK